jgi:hypothetical protein
MNLAKKTTLDLKLPPLSEFLAATLKALYFSFTHSPEEVPRSKEELISALTPHVSDDRVSALIAKLEATQPFRHVFVYSISNKANEAKILEKLDSLKNSEPVCIDDSKSFYFIDSCPYAYPLIRLAHWVKNTTYVPDGIDRLKKISSSFRHSVVVAIKPSIGIVEFRFSGYEQTKLTPPNDRISYLDIANICKAFVIDRLGVELAGLALKAPIEQLINTYREEVSFSKNSSRVGKGRIVLDAGDSDDSGDLKDLIKQAFNLGSREGLPDAQASSAMSSWTAEQVTLNWARFKAATRIDYTGDTPEVMFSWKAAEHRSLVNADMIIKRMVEFADLDDSKNRRKVADAVAAIGADDVITVLDLSQRAGVASSYALEYLLQILSTDKMHMLFRVRTNDHLLDASNNWVASINEIPNIVQTVSGEIIDTTNPKDVEVGFRLIGTVQ